MLFSHYLLYVNHSLSACLLYVYTPDQNMFFHSDLWNSTDIVRNRACNGINWLLVNSQKKHGKSCVNFTNFNCSKVINNKCPGNYYFFFILKLRLRTKITESVELLFYITWRYGLIWIEDDDRFWKKILICVKERTCVLPGSWLPGLHHPVVYPIARECKQLF